jgi:alcohol dehydrogenase YqhD (iron-dependent ADH family)
MVFSTSALGALSGCGSIERGDADASLDGPAAIPDAAIDAPKQGVKYDVGYIDTLTVTPNITSVFGFVAVVNMGTAPLALSTAQVVAFLDDNANLTWTFEKDTPSMALLSPGRAGGFLSLTAKSKVLANGVVTEAMDDQVLSFAMNFANPMVAGTVVHAQAVLSIEGVNVTLPFTITGATGTEPTLTSAKRVLAR